LIRRKATNLENAEAHLWEIWYDWLNMIMPDDFSISYNRQYNKRALEQELGEVDLMMNILQKYEGIHESSEDDLSDQYPQLSALEDAEVYNTQAAAEARAQELGGSGFHTHEEDGVMIYMPFVTHEELQTALMKTLPQTMTPAATVVSNDYKQFKMDMRDRIRQRLEQLLNSSTTDNGF
jgi:hypothetical protein